MNAAARVRAVHPQKVLWIGAHPDDEVLVAPLLAADGQASILVMTHGENGICLLPGGCGSDLGTIRAGEMARSADLLHAHLTLWSFSDVDTDVDAIWSAEAGSHSELVGRIAAVIASEKATIVYSFDPNHGTTCHPAHRALGALVMEAAAQSGVRVMFLETRAEVAGDGFTFSPAITGATPIDETLGWSWLLRDAAVHASQFSPARVAALQETPEPQRRIWLSTVPSQVDLCSPLIHHSAR